MAVDQGRFRLGPRVADVAAAAEFFECLDPFGYLLEISQPTSDVPVEDALAAVAEQWRDAST